MPDIEAAPLAEGDTAESEDGDYNAIMEQLNNGEIPLAPDPNAEIEENSGEDDGEERFELKINGKTVSKTRAEVIADAQKYTAASMKLETAKKEIDEARSVKAQLQNQQNAVRDLMGIMQRGEIEKLTEFVTDKMQAGDAWQKAVVRQALAFYELSKMSPEQRTALENQKLVTKLRAEAEERSKTEQQREFEYQTNQWTEHINIELPKAIQTVGLPNTDFIREQIISTWRAAIEAGKTPTATAVASFVKKRLDEAKLLPQIKAAEVTVVRPKATKESVARRGNGLDTEVTPYQDWETWKKTRGR